MGEGAGKGVFGGGVWGRVCVGGYRKGCVWVRMCGGGVWERVCGAQCRLGCVGRV